MGTMYNDSKKFTLEEALKCYADTVERKGLMHEDNSVRITYMMTTLADVVLSNRRIIDELSIYFNKLVEDGTAADGPSTTNLLQEKLKSLQLSSELFGNNFDAENDSKESEIETGIVNETRNQKEHEAKILALCREIQWTNVNNKKEIEQLLLDHLSDTTTAHDLVFGSTRETEAGLYNIDDPNNHDFVSLNILKSANPTVESILERSVFKSTTENPLYELRAWNTAFENMIAKSVRLIHRHHVLIFNLETCRKLLYILHSTRNTVDQDHESLFEQMLTVSYYCEKENRIRNNPYHISDMTVLPEAENDTVDFVPYNQDRVRRYNKIRRTRRLYNKRY